MSIAVSALRNGQLVRSIEPPGDARVVGVVATKSTMVGPTGRDPIKGDIPAIGLIVDYVMINGPARNGRFSVILHPDDKVRDC